MKLKEFKDIWIKILEGEKKYILGWPRTKNNLYKLRFKKNYTEINCVQFPH